MKLFNNNIVPYASTEGDKIYPIVVDIKKGIKSGEAISFVTADNQVGVITVDFMDGNSSYSIEGCMVTSTIRRPDGTVLEIPCDIISQSTIEIPLGINGTYQEGVHTFDLKIVRGNGKIIGVPTMSYSVSGSLSSDDVVEGDDRLPVLTMVLDNAQDKLARLDKAIAGATNDLEVKEARDGEVTLNARLERDLAKGKSHFVDIEGSIISTESQEGYLENVEILGNTWQDANNLSDIRSVGTKVEGQELYEIPVLSCGKNLFDISSKPFAIADGCFVENGTIYTYSDNKTYNGVNYRVYGIKELTKYTLQCNGINRGQIEIRPITIDGTTIGGGAYTVHATPNTSNPVSITTPVGTKGLSITFNNQIKLNTKFDFKDIILVEGGECTYEPYKEDKLTILSPTPLEKVGDVADRIICKDGVWGVEKNVGTVVVDGSNNWYQASNKPTTAIPEYRLDRGIANYYLKNQNDSCKVNAISNKYNLLGSQSNIWVSTVEGFGVGSYKFYGTIYVSSTYTTLTEFKENLGDLTIKYQLAEPTFIPLPHDQQIKLRTFEGQTNIHFETEIEPTLKAQVPKSLGATVNTHTTQIDNLNKELDRVKKLEESTVSTVTTNKAFTTIAETTQGYFEDVRVEGKTLIACNYIEKRTNRVRFKVKPNTTYTYIMTGSSTISYGVFDKNISFVIQNYELGQINTFNSGDNDEVVVHKSADYDTDNLGGSFLIEGDHTDKDISYFEGLKSVGQDADKIEILSAEIREYITGKMIVYPAQEKPIFQFMHKPTNGEASSSELEPYLKYFNDCGSYANCNNLFDYYSVSEGYWVNLGVWGVSPDSCLKAKEVINRYIGECEGNKKQILYYNPNTETWEKPVLREWDSIEKHSDGKYYYHKRSEEIVLNSSENWSLSTNVVPNHLRLYYENSKLNYKQNANVICDKITYSNGNIQGKDIEGIYITNTIDVQISKTKLSTQDVTGFKQWLQANPVTVVYQLAKEEVYECTNLDLITHNGETNLIVNSGAIQPRITLKVLSNVSNVVKLLQEKVSVLENKFIKGLQQVLAGDMMSLAHLLYPEDFEHEIQTLEL